MASLRAIDTPTLLEMLSQHQQMLTELVSKQEFGIEYHTLKNFIALLESEIDSRKLNTGTSG